MKCQQFRNSRCTHDCAFSNLYSERHTAAEQHQRRQNGLQDPSAYEKAQSLGPVLLHASLVPAQRIENQ